MTLIKSNPSLGSILLIVFLLLLGTASSLEINYRLSQPQIYVDDGHIYLVPAEHRNLVLVANGTGKIIFNEFELNSLISSVKNSTKDLEYFKRMFGSPTNNSEELSQRISSLEQTLYRLNLVDTLDTRLTAVERQLTYNTSSAEGGSRTSSNLNSRIRRLRNRIETLENRLRGLSSSNQNPCSSTPCSNGGSCIPTLYGAFCWCRDGWEGPTCSQDVNECANFLGTDLGCQNGATCLNKPGGYECQCRSGWIGIHCTRRSGDCSSGPGWELCGHGICINQHTGSRPFTCICDQGWKTNGVDVACSVDIDECTSSHPSCSANPPVVCFNTPGSYICGPCPAGYTGNGHRCTDINECLVNNGGCSMNPYVQCLNTPGSRTCGECPAGYMGNGMMCQYVGMCQMNNGGCHPLARCMENPAIGQSYVQCFCPTGYAGQGLGPNGCYPTGGGSGGGSGSGAIGPPITQNPCTINPCSNSGICQPHGATFSCICPPGFAGLTCLTLLDPCQSHPCLNGGLCTRGPSISGYICRCSEDFTGELCQTQVESCGGTLTTLEGFLRYPHDTSEESYRNNVRCVWVIRSDPGKVINVTFTRFHLEGSRSCQYDDLTIRDGGDLSAPIIGKYCGETFPNGGTIFSTHNDMTLAFSSDGSSAGLGFELMWNTTDPFCGGLITNQTHGSINSPGYPNQYPHNRDCIWFISVNLGKRIQLVFATFRIENHPNCSFDYLQVQDGLEEHSTILATYCNTTLPPPLVSSGPYLSIRFHSDDSDSDLGFHVTFAEVPGVPGCGGVLTTPSGVLSSPQHPEPYSHGLECDWLIRLPSPMDRINLKFTTFEIEGSSTCIYDYVEIHDGASPISPLVGRFCGRTIPPSYNSIGNQLLVKFKSDESVSFGGFVAKYEAVCGGMFSSSDGSLRSPYYPSNYPKNRECIYLISQAPGKGILLDFIDFDIESGVDTRCLFDYLEIRDGDNENSTLIGHHCGPPNSAPERVVSTHNYLWIKFKTDGSIQNRGFSANFSTFETGCGGILRASNGLITSPGHPEVYPHGVQCIWVIRGDPGQIVRLTWVSFSLESTSSCGYDYVQVWDNSTLFRNGSSIGKFCGQNTPPVMTSSDNTMTIVFKSDHNVAHDGFMANYMLLNSSTVCGGEFFTESGVIRSPRYPELYPNRKTCVWKLKVGTGKQIMLNVTDFEMENGTSNRCQYDYLEIRNGAHETSPLIGKFCGNVLPPNRIPSFSNTMYLKFSTDFSHARRGFMIFWDGTTTGCGGSLTAPQGSITSPNYPQGYGTRTECIWKIEVNQGSSIQLTFVDLDIQRTNNCWGEHIEIRDGRDRRANLIGKYCHSDSILSVNSTGNAIWIKFLSGFGATGRGFQINYRASCSRVIKGFHGVIESPNFPEPYPHNRNCTWEIQAPIGNKLNISFSHFAMEQSRNNACLYDFVEITEWKKMDSSVRKSLGKFCGDNRPTLISSSKDTIAVNFVSDHSFALNGFRLEWRVHGCGGRIIGSWGRLTSPNYPQKYSNNVECIWQVTTEIGTKVVLNIHELDIERAEDCYYDGLIVYGGPDENSPKLTTLCHSSQSGTIVTSTGNNMYIKFYSDGTVPGRGFSGDVHSIAGGCGGHFKAVNGFISSPNYPNNYDHNEDCIWNIEVDENHIVQLHFMDFAVERHINCSYDYVAIYDGYSQYDPLLMTHCGNEMPIPPIVRSTGNQMSIRLRTDSSSAAKGFKANFTQACGATIKGRNSGVITSPNWPGLLPTGTNCSWIIIGPTPEDRVTLTFTTLNMIPDSSETGCESTFVEVLDGQDLEAPSLGKFCWVTIPPAITSTGNALVLRMTSVFHTGYGFRAIYDHSSSACGGTFSSYQGSFTSPNYPTGYPPNVECTWEILASAGNKIELSFRRFEIQESDYCNTDFVEIHENDAAGKLLGHFCGNQIPANLTAAEKLWVLFRTDGEGQAPGFWADFNLVHGSELNGSYGRIESPLYPIRSTLVGTFTWRITVNDSTAIEITFNDFDFELSSGMNEIKDCTLHTSFTIYDGYDEEAPILLQTCSGTNPPPVTSTGNVVYIKYIKQDWHNWFQISWNEIQDGEGGRIGLRFPQNITGCGGNYSLIEGNSTTLTSPYYPSNYPNNLRCIWGIDSPPHTRIKLKIEEMILEGTSGCELDKLEIYDGREGLPNYVLNKTLCLRSEINTTLITSGRFLELVMQTDQSITMSGFNLTLSTTCGGYLRESRGRITTPGYPGNYITSNCEWIIIVRPGRTIQISFQFFDIYSDAGVDCVTDELIIRNGGTRDSPLLGTGRYCGNVIPTLPESSGNKLYLKFRASTHSRRGFALIYTEVSLGCGGEIYLTNNAPTMTINSPNFPQIPPSFTECEWIISAPQGEAIQLTFQIQFQFQISAGCRGAGIEIHDGGTILSPTLGTYCRDMPSTQKSTGNIMYIRYFTNVPEPRIGFKAEAKIATCGGTIVVGWSNTLTSPGYPLSYEPNLNCLWTIKGPQGSYLSLSFSELELASINPNCTKDRIEIFEDNGPGSYQNWTLCGNQNELSSLQSSTNIIHLRFISDAERESRKGFQLFYRAKKENCGGTLRTPTGIIQSPGYPQPYSHYRHCSWKIFAPEGRRIRLEFLDFDLEETYVSSTGKKFCYDSVLVYQGQWRDLPPLYNKSLCGPIIPAPVETTGNLMTIYFGTDGSVAHRGFKARYSTELPRLCGGTIPLFNGTLSSPVGTTGTPNTTTNIFCDWRTLGPAQGSYDISAGDGTTIVTLHSLQLPPWGDSDPNCLHGFLRISPGSGGYRWPKYCGLKSNIKIFLPISSNGMMIEYEANHLESTFNLTYKSSPCGGRLSGPSDNITSPVGLPGEVECIWILEYNFNSQIKLKFTELDVDDHRNSEGKCDRDYLLVRNGKYQSSPVLGTFCGSNLPPDITSMSNVLWIEYHSAGTSSSASRRGFKLNTEELTTGCGGFIHNKYGQIKSPTRNPSSSSSSSSSSSNNDKYPGSTECEWIIETIPGYVINLLFRNRFEIEQTTNCTNDFIQIWTKNQGTNSDWKPLGGPLCGRQLPPPINTTSTSVKILFRSNGNNIEGDGFTLNWYSPCGGQFGSGIDGTSSGTIQSAHYNSYNHSVAIPGHSFWGRYGWESTYQVSTCDYSIKGQSWDDFIVVEFLRPFEVLVPSSYGFSLTDVTESCPYVNVTMWQGNSSQRHSGHSSEILCGIEPPPVFVGNGAVTISYNYRPTYQNLGWRARYSIFRCGGEVLSPGRISSPGHPFTSAPNMNCNWTIRAPTNRVVRFKFEMLQLEFATGCWFDFVKLFDGGEIRDDKLLGTFCGNMTSDLLKISSKSNVLTVQFKTDWSIQQGGFSGSVDFTVGVQQGCGGPKNVTAGTPTTIQSVDTDNNGQYESYLECQWLISGPDFQALELSFDSFNLEGTGAGKNSSNEDCPYDYLEIRDGPGPYSQLIGKFCGSRIPPTISSSMNFMWIKFVSDGSNNFPGFRARIINKQSPCGGTFILNATKEFKVLTSPGYPSNYPANIRCKWTLDGQSFFDEVDIKFIDLDIPSTPTCSGDRLEIKDVGASYTSPEGIGGRILFIGPVTDWRHRNLDLGVASILQDIKYCGGDKPPDFFTVGRSAELVFNSDSSGSGRGFKIEYKAAACNRTYENPQGRIFSIEYPGYSPIFTSCQFSIRAPNNGSKISLYFNKFLLPGVPHAQYSATDCIESAFEVRDGSPNGPVLGKYCGSSRPNPIFSNTSVLWVKYFTRIELSRGYDITYTTTTEGRGCGGFIFHTGGSFTSPFYPGNYSQDSDCRWRVRVPSGFKIQIEFTSFLIGGDCGTDFLEILSADSHNPSATPSLFTRYCIGDIPSIYNGATDSAVIRYKTSRNNTGNGWRIQFQGIPSSQLPPVSQSS